MKLVKLFLKDLFYFAFSLSRVIILSAAPTQFGVLPVCLVWGGCSPVIDTIFSESPKLWDHFPGERVLFRTQEHEAVIVTF